MRDYGKDFKAIAELMGTKTISHLKSFFIHYRKRYQLDQIIKNYEAKHNNSIIELSDDEDEQVNTFFILLKLPTIFIQIKNVFENMNIILIIKLFINHFFFFF